MPAASRFALRPRSAHEPAPDLTRLVVTHRAICQDLGRLVASLGEGGGRRSRRAAALWRYTAALLAQVRLHNEGEVDILWPVAAAAAGQAVHVAPLADDRHTVAAALSRAGQALAAVRTGSGSPADLRTSLRQLRELLDEHIADEEQQMFPAIRRYLRADAYRWCDRQMQRHAPLPVRRFAAPWLARHARQDELRPLRAASGWPDRILLACSGAGYARLERHAFNASPLAQRQPRSPFRNPTRKEEKK
jgi:Hemerythrin HHE cation binding domain